jgi:hypothetical protein
LQGKKFARENGIVPAENRRPATGPDVFDELSKRIGADAAGYVQSSRRWLLRGFGGSVVFVVVVNLAVRVANAPRDVVASVLLFSLVAAWVAVMVAYTVAIRKMNRAALSGGQYLDTRQYTGSGRIPTAIIRRGPVFIDAYTGANRIPYPSDFGGAAPATPFPSAALKSGEPKVPFVRALRAAVPASTWRISVTGVILIILGVVAALSAALMEILVAVHTIGPTALVAALFVVTLILFGVGAPMMYSYSRHVLFPHEETPQGTEPQGSEDA